MCLTSPTWDLAEELMFDRALKKSSVSLKSHSLYGAHNSSPVGNILREITSVHTLVQYFFATHLINFIFQRNATVPSVAGRSVLVHAIKAYRESRRIDSLIHNLGTWWVITGANPPVLIQRSGGRLQLKCDGTRWRKEGEVKRKLANGVGSKYSSHYLGTCRIQHYYRWCAHLGCQ
jgi:hypothetical protein